MEILKKEALCLTQALNDAGSLLGKPSEMKNVHFCLQEKVLDCESQELN